MSYRHKTVEDSDLWTPERDLWVSVLSRAVLDVIRGPTRIERDQACSFFLKGTRHFRNVCEFAGRDPDYVQEKMKKYILREPGWNEPAPGKWRFGGVTHYRRKRTTAAKRGRPCLKNIGPI